MSLNDSLFAAEDRKWEAHFKKLKEQESKDQKNDKDIKSKESNDKQSK